MGDFTERNNRQIEVLKRLADSMKTAQDADRSLDFSEEIEAVRIAVALFTLIGDATEGTADIKIGRKNRTIKRCRRIK